MVPVRVVQVILALPSLVVRIPLAMVPVRVVQVILALPSLVVRIPLNMAAIEEVPIEAQEVALGAVLVVALVVARVAWVVAVGGLPVDTVKGNKSMLILGGDINGYYVWNPMVFRLGRC